MMLKTSSAAILINIVFFILGALSWEYYRPKIDIGAISNEEYIRIAKQSVEAQKFLEKYPNAKIHVDKSGALAVDFRIDSPDITDSNYLRLRVFINPRNYRPSRKFIDCSGNYTDKNLIEYLQMENCLK